MTWILLLVALALVGGVAYFFSTRKREPERPQPTAPPRRVERAIPPPAAPNDRYWGKQLVVPSPDQACQAARALDGQSYAIGRTPALPLKDCGNPDCACHFVPLRDRRSNFERRAGQERREEIRFEDRKDRRVGHDRRASDHYDWHFTA